MMVSTKQVFLVTGGNSGIGLECSRALAKLANTHVIVAGRNKQRIDEAVADIRRTASSSSVVEAGIFDLSSLKSVRAYADSLIQRDLHFFSVICNAGLQTKKQSTTADGFELTIGTNHIGHFLLVKLLIDRTKRVINLTSETHDPAETKGTGIPPPNMSNLDLLAKGYPKYDMMQIYATSKLCTLLHALEIVRRYPGGPEVIAYSPGLTPDTGLFREHSKLVVPILKFFLKIIFWIRGERMSTSLYSGAYLAGIAAADSLGAKGWKTGDYFSIDRVVTPSEQARDPVLAKAFWEKSEEWVRPFAN
ncbi:hypothetical protein Poli38472_008118 [Pythium oligandrum]|uniref:Protochlorophyllide reductase n=1 Tax=Pythium oligandrum TaxID=41045 RepID=A0A8K1FJZ8_PYTOL|nr:hypothetical protein Poli38472_008118 [Pythium oligandrum]|eukprot:TMW65476.1 hypothetical protein Poli38472_008118 [Pythium oligandrum]